MIFQVLFIPCISSLLPLCNAYKKRKRNKMNFYAMFDKVALLVTFVDVISHWWEWANVCCWIWIRSSRSIFWITGALGLNLTNEGNVQITSNIVDNKDGTYRFVFIPDEVGTLTANVSFSNQEVPNSPFNITVVPGTNENSVKLYGPAVESPVAAEQPTYFVVDCKDAGPGELIGE